LRYAVSARCFAREQPRPRIGVPIADEAIADMSITSTTMLALPAVNRTK
jgi:hypothetical protein